MFQRTFDLYTLYERARNSKRLFLSNLAVPLVHRVTATDKF